MDDMDDDDIADDDMDDDDIDNFDDFEKVETTSALDSANDDAAVSMIPDIADIISVGDDGGGGGGRGRRQWQWQRGVFSVGREDGDVRYDIVGDGRDINDREIEDENDDNNDDDDENCGDGDDEEGYSRSDQE